MIKQAKANGPIKPKTTNKRNISGVVDLNASINKKVYRK